MSGDRATAATEYRRNLAQWLALQRRWPDDPKARPRLARARYELGNVLLEADTPEAVAQLDKALADARAEFAANPADQEAKRLRNAVQVTRAQALALAGRFENAFAAIEEVRGDERRLAAEQRGVASSVRNYAVTTLQLAELETMSPRPRRACAHLDEAERLLSQLRRSGHHVAPDDDYLALVRDLRGKHCR
jgi:tetratricopeptide (TPR) repeat protein